MIWKRMLIIVVLLLFVLTYGYSQKGVGNHSGIARTGNSVTILEVTGTILKVVEEPCTETTGKYETGTHLLIQQNLKSESSVLNIHLGPALQVSKMIKNFEAGKSIRLEVYRTGNLTDSQYIAKSMEYANNLYMLRNSQLKPFWASNQTGRRLKR